MRKHMATYRGVKLYEATCRYITAETMQTYKICHSTMLAVQLFLNSSLFHKMKCPSWTWVKRQKRTSDRTVNGKEAKNTHFRESFVRQESCRTVTTFELAVIQWIYLFQMCTVGNAITCNEIRAIPFFLCLPSSNRPKFSRFQKKKVKQMAMKAMTHCFKHFLFWSETEAILCLTDFCFFSCSRLTLTTKQPRSQGLSSYRLGR